MESKKLSYPLALQRMLKPVLKNAEKMANEEGLKIVMDYIDFHNNICPRCRVEIKSYRGEVRGVGSFGMGYYPEERLLLPYALCKKCSNDMEHEPIHIRNKKATQIENYIDSVLSIFN